MPTSIKWFLPLLTAMLVTNVAHSAVPMAGEQAPGYYRTMVGSFEVTALSDGTVKLPVDKLLLNTTEEHVHETLAANFQSAPLTTSVNGYLINTGKKLVLVDTGAGSLFGPTLGNLANNMAASGYKAGDVDEVYITHMHPDHVGGLVSEGERVFPNAVVRANQQDADFWLSDKNLSEADEGSKGFFQGAMASLNPYVESGQFKPFASDQELVTGVSVIAAKGHTPGHSVYKVESEGDTLMLWGDLIHVAAVQFPEPGIAIQFDTDSEKAVMTRADAFADAAANGYLVGAAHLAFPGLGHLRDAQTGYDFIPANYEGGQ
ncbi:MBL fold metallo-hydrolase [Marinobacter caseinilyticus]|uniref:MBL fold metallo-hydrolase n=1 Tax=Marinobacter caseinilyticus TaxID=2692195 RepID=UPI0014090CCA|nr:MBL fold metallo-hydrolase [Marinobacter caseinilyticus]